MKHKFTVVIESNDDSEDREVVKDCLQDWLEMNCGQEKDLGDSAQIGSSGYHAKIDSTGEDSVIMCAGNSSIVKAKIGSWITLAEWKWSDEKKRYVPVCVKTEYVDGENIKADTWYQLKNGKFVEVGN